MFKFEVGDSVIYTCPNPRRGQDRTSEAVVQAVLSDEEIAIALDGGAGTVLWVDAETLATNED